MPRNPFEKKYSVESLHHSRLLMLTVMIFILSAVLLIRLGYLQLHDYKRYETMSLNNQMSIIPISPPRGIVLDKHGVVLAENIPVYVLEIIPEHIKDMPKTLKALKKLIPSITDEDIANFDKTRRQNRSYVPIALKLKLTQEEVATFASNQYRFTGVSIKAKLMRYYPLGEVTAHLLGYVSRINIQELREIDAANYRGTDFIGKAGIEKYYEDLLHGQVGYQQVETDVSGRTLRVVDKQNPVSGEKLYLSIDIRLQKIAYEALKNNRGAVVAINPNNGEILAMVSSPSYDPNLFVNGIRSKDYKILSDARERPLYNRAVRGLYPPASTIKPYIALIGLDTGTVDTHYSVYDPGWFKLPGVSHAYRDWRKTGHGSVNVSRAITVSCDTYFYQLGHKIGIATIDKMLRQFGFGQLTQVDLNEEASGIVPNAQWKRATKGASWYPGDTLITSIGQGFMLASPLQIANAVATLSQKGKRYRPHLLHKSVQSDNDEVHVYKPIKEVSMTLRDENHWNVVHEAMHSVITNNEGTGYRFGRDAPYSVAAKTGTAQVFGGKHYDRMRNQVVPEYLRDHSLFIAFSPVEKPEIAIAVMVENDTIASQVARKTLDGYFQLKKEDNS